MNDQRPVVFDLFAGAGLFSHAFAREGFAVRHAVEQDAAAAKTYARNLGEHIVVGDVRRRKPPGRCDVLVGGPPCQGFSSLGTRRERDPRNSLSLQMVRWAELAEPSLVVIENVPRFLDSQVWRTLRRRLERLGYEVTAWVLDAADYGVAQLRSRSFTIASRVGLPAPPPRSRAPVSVRQAWKGLTRRPDGRNWHVAPEPSDLALARMRAVPPEGDRRDILAAAPELAPPSWHRLACQVTDIWGRLRWDCPAPTLRTRFQNPSLGRYVHPTEDRVISLREGARLHSIPDTWEFVGYRTQVCRQIGNSVPPKLGRAVARAVKRQLLA